VTSQAQTMVSDSAYAPFGEQYSARSGTVSSSFYDFTGQQQWTTQGLDDFLFRRYHPVQGRWISPDPAGIAAVDMTNPQTWNRYAYVGNNPLNAVDPKGLYLCETDAGSGQTECNGEGPGGSGPGAGGGVPWNLFENSANEIEYFYGGQFSGVWSQADMNAYESQQFFMSQGVFQELPSQQNPAGQSAYWAGQYMKRLLGDPCVYLNDAGTAVDTKYGPNGGVDYHSSPGECAATGGQWIPPQPFGTTYTVVKGQVSPVTLSSRICGAVGRIGDFMTGIGLGTWMQGRALSLSTIAGDGGLVIEGSEFGPVGTGLAIGGLGLQAVSDLCE
jgi:RHS repeat-associated protein